ncbi:MAG: TVP38/TMEM64 family protein [Anaerolineales bacterium]|nr:TVP38/TMEM64 family protein [Anaerolineales bacterium]MCB9126775.1 TVP38/TMEM64 family protein [Ardenticatenales bacterium]MCB9172634.1 TVP38/TMEM64 family protein [Ardenticatenales bacterium]
MTEPQTPLTAAPPSASFWQRQGRVLFALLIWAILIVAYIVYTRQNALTPLESAARIDGLLRGTLWGPLIYIVIYLLRPLIFFPATVLTILGGYTFGLVWGIVLTVIGSNGSALIAYWIGKLIGGDLLSGKEAQALLDRYTRRLRENSFESVLIMRFLFLPYDLVNYLCGFLRIDPKAFLLATALGSIPGTISFVLAGASISGDLSAGNFSLDPRSLVASAIIFVVSIAISRLARRREADS